MASNLPLFRPSEHVAAPFAGWLASERRPGPTVQPAADDAAAYPRQRRRHEQQHEIRIDSYGKLPCEVAEVRVDGDDAPAAGPGLSSADGSE